MRLTHFYLPCMSADKEVAKLPICPKGEDYWHVIVHKLRVWAPVHLREDGASSSEDADDVAFVRPYLILIVSARSLAVLLAR